MSAQNGPKTGRDSIEFGIRVGLRFSFIVCICGVVIGTAILGIVGFDVRDAAEGANDGKQMAERDWHLCKAVLYIDFPPTDGRRMDYYDQATGLRFQVSRPFSETLVSYNQRVQELLSENGLPPWTMKAHLPTESELAESFDNDKFRPIDRVPYIVSPDISIVSGVGDVYSESVIGRTIRSPTVLLPRGDQIRAGLTDGAIYVGASETDPEVFFIRNERAWSGAFHKSGKCLMWEFAK